jgi:hypothetical protein
MKRFWAWVKGKDPFKIDPDKRPAWMDFVFHSVVILGLIGCVVVMCAVSYYGNKEDRNLDRRIKAVEQVIAADTLPAVDCDTTWAYPAVKP